MSSPPPIKRFVVSDKVSPRLEIRHERDILGADAAFEHVDAHRERRAHSGMVSSSPIKMKARVELVQSDADSKTSLLVFGPVEVRPEMPLGVYECTSLVIRYPHGGKAPIDIPDNLKFEVVEAAPDTLEVERVEWGDAT